MKFLKALIWSPTPTTSVSYVSSNRVLIVAEKDLALDLESQLPEKMQTYLALLSSEFSPSAITNAWNVNELTVTGYLGRFSVSVKSTFQEKPEYTDTDLGKLFNIANGLFDHVIDCQSGATDTGCYQAARLLSRR